MGMFDYVIAECELPDNVTGRVMEWQTKTFDHPFMHKYRITAAGRLERERVHYEDRSDPNAEPGSLASIAGMMTAVHEGWDDLNYHGILNFYGYADGVSDWYEYDAKFTDGNLVGLERIVREPLGTTARALREREP